MSAEHKCELAQTDQTLAQAWQQQNNLLWQQWQYCVEKNIGILTLNQEAYPPLLKQIYDPPPILYYRGDIALITQPQLAMVGSRRSTQQGNSNALLFAKAFAKAGFTVTSGMALGIDTESHLGALDVEGKTIAVLGRGVDVVYPWRNRHLYQRLIDKGLIVSELPLGSEPKQGHFPRRNRIISGLSLGVLVVEASLQSGSLITAKCALEQDREVFAMPGSIHNPASRGCHALIRQGAKLVETVDHVMEEFNGWLNDKQSAVSPTQPQQDPSKGLAAKQQQLLALIGFDAVSIDALQQRSNISVTELMAELVQLELAGLVENIAGHYQRVVKN